MKDRQEEHQNRQGYERRNGSAAECGSRAFVGTQETFQHEPEVGRDEDRDGGESDGYAQGREVGSEQAVDRQYEE